MPVLINRKICDNSPECSGIAACPSGALYFDDDKNTIIFDESKCTECGKCACCPVGAIYFTADKNEFETIKRQVGKDPRRISDLFVNRYGAQTLPDHYVIEESELESKVLDQKGKIVLEVVTDETIECLLKSIPVKVLFDDSDYRVYRKLLLKNLELLEEYSIEEFPCLLFFEDGKLKGKIEGFYGVGKEDELKAKIKELE